MSTDITKSLHETNCKIIEINATPGLSGDKELCGVDTGKKILEYAFR
ncbi:MAG: hypothetical protein U9Q15_00270 [Patescibacteria group bacterium]|nr:hypothetical protein [Patescibacteria group bacterium]